MNDRELLVLAAKASGFEVKEIDTGPFRGELKRRVVPAPSGIASKWLPWRPLKDDADAFDLIVRLHLDISHNMDEPYPYVGVHTYEGLFLAREPLGENAKSTRRAITRAAAALADKE